MKTKDVVRIRKKFGLTQAETADVLGLASAAVVSNIETGFRMPARLGVAVLQLLDEMPPNRARFLIKKLTLKNRALR